MSERGVFPSVSSMERFDGSKWKIFNLPNGGQFITTSAGEKLVKEKGNDLFHALNEYKDSAEERLINDSRRHLRSGGNSDVYVVGDLPVVIKEATSAHSAFSSLDRMDHLAYLCENYMPEHIKVPQHYGSLNASSLNKQYIIMEKANEGVIIEDLSRDKEVNGVFVRQRAIEEMEKARGMIFDLTGEHFKNRGKDSLLPDYHYGNIIVDFGLPVADLPFTLWIIDQ